MLGQYFTTNVFLQKTVKDLILNNPTKILEPSVGRGDLLTSIPIPYDAYEIDSTLDFVIPKESIVFGDFLKQNITQKYTTIIGNPPFIQTKKGNVYLDFIKKCCDLLSDDGEIVFIVPSNFLKATKSGPVISTMLAKGHFTHVVFPNNESVFKDAAIDVMVFRYQKGVKSNTTIVNNTKMFLNFNTIVTFSNCVLKQGRVISDLFDVYVGIVSGLDSVFEHHVFGNIDVLVDLDKTKRMILIDTFPTPNAQLNEYMMHNKPRLLCRKIRKFTDVNWFEWGALRNARSIIKYFNEPCIYIKTMTRQPRVAFIGRIMYFGCTLLMLRPKTPSVDIQRVCDFLNSDEFKTNFVYSNRFKITHNQIGSTIY